MTNKGSQQRLQEKGFPSCTSWIKLHNFDIKLMSSGTLRFAPKFSAISWISMNFSLMAAAREQDLKQPK